MFCVKYVSFISLKFDVKGGLMVNNLDYIYQKSFKYGKLVIKLQMERKKNPNILLSFKILKKHLRKIQQFQKDHDHPALFTLFHLYLKDHILSNIICNRK